MVTCATGDKKYCADFISGRAFGYTCRYASGVSIWPDFPAAPQMPMTSPSYDLTRPVWPGGLPLPSSVHAC